MTNLARFIIEGSVGGESPSSDMGYDAVHSETLAFRLESSAQLVRSFSIQVFSPDVPGAPLASGGAPLLVLEGGTSGQAVLAATPGADITTAMPVSGIHFWIVRCVVDGGFGPDGNDDPNRIFERAIAIRSPDGNRKTVATESTQYQREGWAEVINQLVEAVATLGGGLPVWLTLPAVSRNARSLGVALAAAGVAASVVSAPLRTARSLAAAPTVSGNATLTLSQASRTARSRDVSVNPSSAQLTVGLASRTARSLGATLTVSGSATVAAGLASRTPRSRSLSLNASGNVTLAMIALLIAVACTAPLTPAERDCLATVEVHEDAELLVCVAREGDGKCPNATIDEIADRHDVAAERCVE